MPGLIRGGLLVGTVGGAMVYGGHQGLRLAAKNCKKVQAFVVSDQAYVCMRASIRVVAPEHNPNEFNL